MSDGYVSVEQALKRVRSGRAEWDAVLEMIPQDRMELPFAEGGWSVKDLIGHVMWYEREMLVLVRERVLAGSEWWGLAHDKRNARVLEASRERSLVELLDEHGRVCRELVVEMEKLTDEDFNDAARIADMPADWRLWMLIAENTYEHYPEHIETVREWLEA